MLIWEDNKGQDYFAFDTMLLLTIDCGAKIVLNKKMPLCP